MITIPSALSLKRTKILRYSCLLFCLLSVASFSQEKIILVDAESPGATVQPTMYGIFFEDINFGADGGLYAELIKNRSFEFDNHLMGWNAFGNVKIMNENPCFEKNPNYARLSFRNELMGTGLENEGYRGIGLKAGDTYRLKFYARSQGTSTLKIRFILVNSNNGFIGSKTVDISGTTWKEYETELIPSATDTRAKIRIILDDIGVADLDHISLFPEKTYKNQPNGLREDLAKALEELKPGLFRFPGGCIVEGTTMATRYQWKNTIGPVENRPTNINRWNYTFDNRRFHDYYQSLGLGFFEYFRLSEDIGAEPLPVLNCGLSCQFENQDDKQHCKVENLQPYIQDALDLIEFANGTTDSKWGKIRSDMGHPAPFNLKFMAIGNEQWGELYPERLQPFLDALRKEHPEIKIVGSAGPYPDGKDFDFGWKEMRHLKADLVDEHYYRNPKWFLSNAGRYDNYDRNGPKVFAGEYACHTESRKNSFEAALCEGAFMTGLERNADVVWMTAYAPLFAHVENWQWRPDLIWFDNLNVVRTPSYYVQQLYSRNAGTQVLKTVCNDLPLSGQDSLYASSVADRNKNQVILKIANTSSAIRKVKYRIDGLKAGQHNASITVLHRDLKEDDNTIENPNKVIPVQKTLIISGNEFQASLEPESFNLFVINMN